MFVNDFLLFIDKFTKEDDKEGKRTKDDAGAVRKDRPGAVFLLSLPDYCFFIFIEKQ